MSTKERRVVVSGGSGLVGNALIPVLLEQGYTVTQLVRSAPAQPTLPGVTTALWNPARGTIAQEAVDSAFAVINLSGSGIASKRWDRVTRKEIRTSRISSTSTLAAAVVRSSTPPQVFLSASATGFYGFPGVTVNESSTSGDTFLAGVCVDWERAATSVLAAGTRLACLRTGLIMTPAGGTLKKLLLPLKLGVGGPLGTGQQVWSWISLEDHIRAIIFLLEQKSAWGPVNLVAPQATTNAELTHAFAQALHRPDKFRVPEKILRLALGQFSGEVVRGVEVQPTVLESLGFSFNHPLVADLVHWATTPSSPVN